MRTQSKKVSKSSSVHKKFTKDLLKAGYAKNSKQEEERLQQLGMTKDTSLSQKKDKVYVDKKGKAYIVYKGTNPTDFGDLATDMAVGVGLGRYTPRFKNGRKLARKV